MRFLAHFCIAGLILFVTGCSLTGSTKTMVGRPAPPILLFRLDGEQISLDEYEGKPVVLLFWSQWCFRSRSFIQDLSEISNDLRRRGVEVVSVDIDKQERFAALKEMIKERNLVAIEHTFSGNDIYDQAYLAFDPGEVPTAYILNRQHTIVAQGNSIDFVRAYFNLQ